MAWRRVLIFLALWLFFESTISWFATCQPIYEGTAKYGGEKDHCTLFNGPVVSISRFLVVQTARFLHIYEHELVAGFTIVLGISTILLWISTNRLWQTTKDAAAQQSSDMQASIQLARDEFIASRRPKVILREAFMATVLEGEPISVTIHLSNIGESKATIIRSTVAVMITRADNFRIHPTVDVKNDLGIIELEAGAATLISVPGEMPKWEAQRVVPQIHGQSSTPLVRAVIDLVGQVIYVDGLEIPRRTAFHRRLNTERRRFYRIEDEPDMDYSD